MGWSAMSARSHLNYSTITTVVDIEMQCGALITRTRDSAIAEGSYDLMAEGSLRLSYLTEDASIVIGDTVGPRVRAACSPRA